MVVETGLGTFSQGCGALSQGKQPVDEVHVLVDLLGLGEGTEVLRAVLDEAPCREDLGEILL